MCVRTLNCASIRLSQGTSVGGRTGWIRSCRDEGSWILRRLSRTTKSRFPGCALTVCSSVRRKNFRPSDHTQSTVTLTEQYAKKNLTMVVRNVLVVPSEFRLVSCGVRGQNLTEAR